MGSYFVIVTCRNSQTIIADAILSLQHQTVKPTFIIVINDGSTDNTLQVLQNYQKNWPQLYIINHPDWGYDISRMVRNWNEALQFAANHNLPVTDYHMIATDNTVYESKYAEKLMQFLDNNSSFVVVSGDYDNQNTEFPHGAGRFVSNKFFERTQWNNRYPERIGHETAILYEAIRLGFKFKVLQEATFLHKRNLALGHKFIEWGITMKALGYSQVFAWLRCINYFVKGGSIGRIGALRMLNAYLNYELHDFENENKLHTTSETFGTNYNYFYPLEFREYVKRVQLKGMINKIISVAKS
jgi:glycosyltransferase involved in cell wall biosynthesis